MRNLSLGAAAEQTKLFMRREGPLVVPVAFATFGIALIVMGLVTPEPAPGEKVQPGLWSLALLPLMFLLVLGQLAISHLVLRPAVTVRDALGAATARLPMAAVVVLLLMGIILIAGLILLLAVGVIAALVGASMEGATTAGATVTLVLILIVVARLLMVWPMLIDRRTGPVATLKDAFALSRGHLLKFLALFFAFMLVSAFLTGAVQLGLGSVLLIIGKLSGMERAAAFLTAIIVALFAAIIQTVWAVFLTNIYRQLATPAATSVPSTR